MTRIKHCLLFCTFFIAICISISAKKQNLIPNGDFESKNEGWRSSASKGTKASKYAMWDSEAAHSGKNSLKLFLPDPMKKTVRWHSPIFSCKGNITVSLWLETDRVMISKGGWEILRIVAFDSTKKSVKFGNSSSKALVYFGSSRHPKDGWKHYSKEIALPENARYARIDLLAYNCTGVTRLDDVEISQSSGVKKATKVKKNTRAKKPMSAVERAEEAELARFQATKKTKKYPSRFLYGSKKGTKLEIEEVNIKGGVDQLCKKKASAKVPRIKINGPNLLKNGENTFFAWWWLGADSWHDKMLGFDCFSYHIQNRNPIIHAKKQGDKVRVYTSLQSPSDLTQMERVMDQGLLPFIHFYENKHSTALKKLAPDRLINSHYWLYCDEDPEMRRIRRNSWKSVLRITRNYPSLVYNLNNETYYMDYCIWNVKKFRKQIQEKYKNIKTANSIWKTKYKNFDEVLPPYSTSTIFHSRKAMKNFNSQMLWLDWVKFTEAKFAETIAEQRAYVRSIDPGARVCIKTPTGLIRGDRGIYPPSVAAVEDMYCTEISTQFFGQYPGEENKDEIKSMLRTVLRWDIVRNASKGKPIIADESSPFTVDKLVPSQYLVSNADLVSWKFKSASASMSITRDTKDTGTKKGWWRKNYDDSTWGSIKVPGIWGQSGHKDTTIGWYRKSIKIPEAEKVYLNGFRLADFADVYVNGKLVKNTSSWKEHFNIDITALINFKAANTIAIRIVNKYKQGGFIWGGIRGYINITKTPGKTKLNAGQMRSHYWTALMHGCSGLGMFKYPKNAGKYSIECLRVLPYMKKEMETVGDIVLARPRIKGKIGLFYPYDTFRYFLPVSWKEIKNNPIAQDLTAYYAGAVFSGIPVDIIRGDETLAVWSKYPVIVLRSAKRVTPKTLKLIKDYVKTGGTLLLDFTSVKVDDGTDKLLKNLNFLGAQPGKSLDKPGSISVGKIKIPTTKSQVAKNYGIELIPLKGSKVFAKYASGKAAITLKSLGKGKIYYVGAELGMSEFERLIIAICDKENIIPPIKFRATKAGNLSYVERYLFKKGNKFVIYLNNWGAKAKGRIMLPTLPRKEYCVRDVQTGKKIYQGNLRNKALNLTIRSQSPHILLVEEANNVTTKIKKLSPEHDAFMQRIWKKTGKGKTKVLMYVRGQKSVDKRSNPQVLLPTLPLLLKSEDFKVDMTYSKLAKFISVWDYSSGLHDSKLEDYQIIFIPSPNHMAGVFSPKEIELLQNFVANGGGIFVCGMNNYGIHMSSKVASSVLKPFGLSIRSVSLRSKDSFIMKDPRFITFKNFNSKHPILNDVNIFQSMGSTFIESKKAKGKLTSLITSTFRGKDVPVLAAMEYGEGRIVIVGESNWMWPEWLQKKDNAQLAVNIFNWLADEKIKKLDRKKAAQIIKTPF